MGTFSTAESTDLPLPSRDLADINNDGCLTRDGFAVAMHLIQRNWLDKTFLPRFPGLYCLRRPVQRRTLDLRFHHLMRKRNISNLNQLLTCFLSMTRLLRPLPSLCRQHIRDPCCNPRQPVRCPAHSHPFKPDSPLRLILSPRLHSNLVCRPIFNIFLTCAYSTYSSPAGSSQRRRRAHSCCVASSAGPLS